VQAGDAEVERAGTQATMRDRKAVGEDVED